MSKNNSKNAAPAVKPLIGVNTEFRPGKSDAAALTWLQTGYVDCIEESGGLPMVIPFIADDADLERVLSGLDGFVLTGSALDLDPARMGMDPHPASRPMASRREDFDRRLCKMLVELKIPTLCIGSGMQLMNVVCGGTLHQHIAESCPRAIQHRDRVEAQLRHIIDIVPGTRIDQIYGPGEIRVNSHHHMAVDQVASLFRVSATCPDGIVEAFESIEEDWCCLATQWHPEADDASRLDMQVFEHFVSAAAATTEAVEEQEVVSIPFPQKRSA